MELNFFERQGYPRELLFWLFADFIRITYKGKTAEFRNEPSEEKSCEFVPQRRCFVNYVDAAIDTGFRVETRVVQKATTGSDGKTKLVPKTEARTCFDPVLADRARREVQQGVRTRQPRLAGTAVNPICGSRHGPRKMTGRRPAVAAGTHPRPVRARGCYRTGSSLNRRRRKSKFH